MGEKLPAARKGCSLDILRAMAATDKIRIRKMNGPVNILPEVQRAVSQGIKIARHFSSRGDFYEVFPSFISRFFSSFLFIVSFVFFLSQSFFLWNATNF